MVTFVEKLPIKVSEFKTQEELIDIPAYIGSEEKAGFPAERQEDSLCASAGVPLVLFRPC